MTHYPLTHQVADIEKLQKVISESKPHAILQQWADTAAEIEPTKRAAIQNTKAIYAEMTEPELQSDRLLLFIETVLEKLSSNENRELLITAEAISARR